MFLIIQRKIKEEWAERERKEKEEQEAKEKEETEKRQKQVICTEGLIFTYPEMQCFSIFFFMSILFEST